MAVKNVAPPMRSFRRGRDYLAKEFHQKPALGRIAACRYACRHQ
jgi:hypothetical protein